VAAGLRRAITRGFLTLERTAEVLVDYLDLSLTRHDHGSLFVRVLELRHNFTAYDATYVALAEGLGADLLTTDQPLQRAVKAHTEVVVLPGSVDST
jgi:predicted nucleic acid-binding protein